MFIFIIAAAAAFLLCGPFVPEQLSNWLEKKSHAVRLILPLFLLSAVLFILIAAAASPRAVAAIMLGLPILILILGVWSLLNRLPTMPPRPMPIPVPYRPSLTRSRGFKPRPRPDEIPAVEWPCRGLLFVLLGLLVISPLAAVGGVIVVLVPAAIVSWVPSWVPVGLPWLLATYTWLIAVVLYALLTCSANPAFKWLRGQKCLTRLVLGSLLLIAVFSTLIAWNGDAWAYAVLLTTRRIASMRETTYAVLGAIAGLMCGNFPRWMKYAGDFGIGHTGEGVKPVESGPDTGDDEPRAGKPASGLWPVIIFAGALACVALAAVLAPYEQTVLSRLSGVETPYLKVQFAIPPSLADRQQFLEIERDLVYTDTLEEWPRSFRFIQYDCAQAALDAGIGITALKLDKPEKYTEFTTGIAFGLSVLPYVNQLVNAKRKGYNRVVLNLRARQVAEKIAPLATKENLDRNDPATILRFKEDYQSAMSEIKRQRQRFREEGVEKDLTVEESRRRITDRDPEYCWPSDAEISSVSDGSDVRNVRTVIRKNPRPILELAAVLFHFAGDIAAANAMRTHIFKLDPATDDINTFGSHAAALYIERGDLREVIELRQALLQTAESRLETAMHAKVWNEEQVKADSAREIDNKARGDLETRYRRARFVDQLRLAYLWAQHGLAAEGDLLPDRGLHWWSAQKYADDAYETLLDRSRSPPRFTCMDDDLDLIIKDTYAFVKLAYQAYNLKTRRIPPDEHGVRQAREILEDALAAAREEHRRLLEARPSCLTLETTTAWIRRISSHLRLADALQP